jgi:hypothetical protein
MATKVTWVTAIVLTKNIPSGTNIILATGTYHDCTEAEAHFQATKEAKGKNPQHAIFLTQLTKVELIQQEAA